MRYQSSDCRVIGHISGGEQKVIHITAPKMAGRYEIVLHDKGLDQYVRAFGRSILYVKFKIQATLQVCPLLLVRKGLLGHGFADTCSTSWSCWAFCTVTGWSVWLFPIQWLAVEHFHLLTMPSPWVGLGCWTAPSPNGAGIWLPTHLLGMLCALLVSCPTTWP